MFFSRVGVRVHSSELYRKAVSMYVLKTLILWFMLILFEVKMFLKILIGSHTFVFRCSMSLVVSSLLPSNLMFFQFGSGGVVLVGNIQSRSDQVMMFPGAFSGGGGGVAGGRLSGASHSSVFVRFTLKL